MPNAASGAPASRKTGDTSAKRPVPAEPKRAAKAKPSAAAAPAAAAKRPSPAGKAAKKTLHPITELNTIDTIPPAKLITDLDAEQDEPAALDEADAVEGQVVRDLPGSVDDAPGTDDPVADLLVGEADIDDEIAAVADEDLDAVAAAPEEEDEEEDDLPPVSNRVAPRMPGHMPGVPNRPIMHARMPAKAEIFHEGDHVVYPTHGVGKVERIATEEIAGHKLELIHITFEENRMTLRVPVSKARSAGLRKLASRKMFDDAMAVLKGRARIKRTMWSRRAQEYEAKINSGDPIAIAEVVRDLHRNAGQPDQSFSERQIYEAAMDRLAAELAALDKTDKPAAVAKLGDFLKTV